MFGGVVRNSYIITSSAKKGILWGFFSYWCPLFIPFSCPIGLAKTSNYCVTMERVDIPHFIPDLTGTFSAFSMMVDCCIQLLIC